VEPYTVAPKQGKKLMTGRAPHGYYVPTGTVPMPLQLTPDELRELALAIDAYKEELERYRNTGSANSSLRALQTAREKINRAYRESEDTNAMPRRYAAGHALG
jgi:hypothetical protein